MRLVILSDTHALHEAVTVPDGDVLIHCGDFMNSGWEVRDIRNFNNWLGTLPHQHKLVIAGNHDRLFEMTPIKARSLLTNATYLEDSGVAIDGWKFWGSPWTPAFHNWAFNRERGADIKRAWDLIPEDTNVLITHGPPYQFLDFDPLAVPNDVSYGCLDLLDAIDRIAPKLHAFGHIHAGYGTQFIQGTQHETLLVNAAICNEKYEPVNTPWVLETDGL